MFAVEQHRVVDRQRRSARQVFRELDVRVVVAAVRRGRDERDRAENAATGAQRDDHRRAKSELAHVPQVLLVPRSRGEHLVRHLGVELGVAGADHVRDSGLRARVDRVALAELAGKLDLGLIGVCHHDAVELAALVDHLDPAPVGDMADRERRELVERRFGIQGTRQELAGLGQEALAVSRRHARPRTSVRG